MKKLALILGFITAVFGDEKQGMPAPNMETGCNAAARIEVNGAWDVSLDGEFLYMQLKNDHDSYASTSTNPSFPVDETVEKPSPGWHPGVRAGLGINLDRDEWTILADWTHLISTNKGKCSNPPGGVVIPKLFNYLDIVSVGCDNAKSKTKVNYNVVSLVLGRPFYLGKCLTIRPSMGLMGHWMKEAITSDYYVIDGYYTQSTGITHFTLDWAKKISNYKNWGVGPRFGVGLDWLLYLGFKVIGSADVGLLYTRINNSVRERVSDISQFFSSSSDTLSNGKQKKQNFVKTNLKANIGLGWGTYFDRNKWYVDLSIVYELHYWFDLMETDLWDIENLWLHGGIFKLQFNF